MDYCRIEAPYPKAESGEKRIVFALDPKGDHAEQARHMLQLIPGRVTEMSRGEAANHQILGGNIEQHTVEGWGAPYFRITLAKDAASTLMHVLDENKQERVRKFVAMSSPPMFPYASDHPVVVYLPKDAELRYSIWSGGEPQQAGTE
ncbi:inhibitor of serine peptidase (ISP) [Novymonas esmeraldas]|uniref:Inhibitor of serine peptidase (ISP) n=1 Tax=Novymonas esmeraldas TaxID=1808958 RepID=A0AAW0ET11_9TRYP